jgi:hypothetical protein
LMIRWLWRPRPLKSFAKVLWTTTTYSVHDQIAPWTENTQYFTCIHPHMPG